MDERIAAEEKAEERAEAKRLRKLEVEERAEAKRVAEARAAEELEAVREEAARVASIKLTEQHEAASKRAYEQQVALIKLQAEIGERAAIAQRMEQEAGKKRDRAVASISNYREQEDIEDFLMTSERKLRAGEIPEREWLTVLSAKLSGKVGSSWQDLCATSEDYQEVKGNLLKVCGYTPKIAGEVFYGFRAEHTRGMSADQLYHRGVQLVRRMVAPLKLSEAMEFAISKPWVSSAVSKKARMMLDSRAVSNPVELIDALQDHLVMEGDRTEGQYAVFRKQAHGSEVSGSDRKVTGGAACFKCGKPGHKSFECWQNKGSAGSTGGLKPAANPSSSAKPIVCYTCGEEGHKSPQCTKIKREKVGSKDAQPRPVKQLWYMEPTDSVLEGKVNGVDASILLDSGATISVVPEDLVGPDLLTGSYVSIRTLQTKVPMVFPTAKVSFKIDELEWEELVAVAPVIEGQSCTVSILGL